MFYYLLTGILLVFALAAWSVHGFYQRTERRQRPPDHYVFVTRDQESRMEWYIRALAWYAFVRGKRIKLTVMDVGSSDQTLSISHRLREQVALELSIQRATTEEVRLHSYLEPEATWIDLRNQRDAKRIPFV